MFYLWVKCLFKFVLSKKCLGIKHDQYYSFVASVISMDIVYISNLRNEGKSLISFVDIKYINQGVVCFSHGQWN